MLFRNSYGYWFSQTGEPLPIFTSWETLQLCDGSLFPPLHVCFQPPLIFPGFCCLFSCSMEMCFCYQIKNLTFIILYLFYILPWVKYGFVRFALISSFTFFTASQRFGNRSCNSKGFICGWWGRMSYQHRDSCSNNQCNWKTGDCEDIRGI